MEYQSVWMRIYPFFASQKFTNIRELTGKVLYSAASVWYRSLWFHTFVWLQYNEMWASWKFFLRRWITCDYVHWTENNWYRTGNSLIQAFRLNEEKNPGPQTIFFPRSIFRNSGMRHFRKDFSMRRKESSRGNRLFYSSKEFLMAFCRLRRFRSIRWLDNSDLGRMWSWFIITHVLINWPHLKKNHVIMIVYLRTDNYYF